MTPTHLELIEGFAVHPMREAVLGELHARPFTPLNSPARIRHYAFMVDAAQASASKEAFSNWCTAHAVTAPAPDAKHHRVAYQGITIAWEQHTEFATWTLFVDTPGAATPTLAAIGLEPQGQVIVAIDLHMGGKDFAFPATEDTTGMAAASLADGKAMVTLNFKPDETGHVQIRIRNNELVPTSAGALAQRLIEIETYRTIALLGLPEAQRVGPAVRRIEMQMARISQDMTTSEGLAANQDLLNELTLLAAELEAMAAVSAYRFGASRAYAEIVQQRLRIIKEVPSGTMPTIESFLERRMAPAMRTCVTTAERQADLSRKLTRATNLLRTRVDVELERQNRDLLATMNERARMQLRLQQTVEGLSVAAIGYYVVSLFGYFAKGFKSANILPVEVEVATALFVPVALLLVWWAVRGIRRRHGEAPKSGQ